MMRKAKVVFCVALCVSIAAASVPRETLETMLRRGAARALHGTQHPTETASNLGTVFVAQYFVMNHFIGNAASTALEKDVLRRLLLELQQENGSWQQVFDANVDTGMLEGTVWAYWALKIMGEDTNSSAMARARSWILANGGIEKCNTMHKLFFSVTNNLGFDGYTWIPLFIFESSGIEKPIYIKNHVSQWVYPHLTAMAWLIHFKPSHDLGPLFHIDELHVPTAKTLHLQRSQTIGNNSSPSASELNLIQEIFKMQQPRGSFGAYTLSTMLSVLALQDAAARFGVYKQEIGDRIAAAIKFMEELECNTGYRGDTDHGEWWDAVLLGSAMREAGMSAASLESLGETVASQQQPSGGVPFGYDFEYAPDVDDTALSILFWSKLSGFSDEIAVAERWLTSMQNKDGGFGAFAKGIDGTGLIGWLIELMAHQFEGSAEIFDPSEADVTAHILEALGSIGRNVSNSKLVNTAIDFIKSKQQQQEGFWVGRWAINAVYCTGAVVVGLSRVGHSLQEPWVASGIRWILSKQNADGGWGESSASYVDASWIGRGISTPTQTAWALVALLEAEKAGFSEATPAIEKGIDHLAAAFQQDIGSWTDASCVGTGHPKLVYMNYPSYSLTFPLIATARYYTARFGPVPQLLK